VTINTDTIAIEAVIDYAATIQERGNGDRWDFADLILLATPEEIARSETSRIVNAIVTQMNERSVTKQDGTPYLPAYLSSQRLTALAWTPPERQDEASFEVHAENRGKTKPVLVALCAAARGEEVDRPAGCSRTAWQAALAKISTKKTARYKVQTQAVRIALQKGGKNSPTRFMDDTLTYGELVRHLIVGIEGLQAFDRRIESFDLDTEQRQRFLKVIDTLVSEATKVRVKLAVDLSDEALAELLK
jgi:hypothetical protein